MKDYVKGLKYCPPQPSGPRPGHGPPQVPGAVVNPPKSVVSTPSPTQIPKAVVTPPRSKVGL